MRKRVLALIAAVVALVGGGVAMWAAGPEAAGGPVRDDIGGSSIARLDTVSLASGGIRRRLVIASMSGRVLGAESDTDLLVADGSGTITVRLGEAHGLQNGATLLARGLLRQAPGSTRRLDAIAWSEVESGLFPARAAPDSVRLEADTTRFGTDPDRSPVGSDRSPEAR